MISQNKTFMQPKRVIVPLYTQNKLEILIDENSDVSIGQPLMTTAQAIVYSPVSGKVQKVLKNRDKDNDLSFHAVIENDHKNTVHPSISKLTTEALIIRYFQGVHRLESLLYTSDFPIIINTVFTNEPFVSLDPKFMEENSEILHKTLSQLHTLFPFKEILILTKEETAHYFKDFVDLPTKVEIVEPEKQKDYAYKRVNSYFNEALVKKRPYQYLTMDSILKLHDMITEHRPFIFTYVVISGDAVKQQARYKIRIGTPYSSLKRIFQGYTTEKPMTMTLNALLENISIMHESYSITHDIYSIHIQEHREYEQYDCISCGRCNSHCPVGIFPSKIMHYANQNIYLESMQSHKCIDCGLCSYVCPSKINVMAFVKDAKERIRRKKL